MNAVCRPCLCMVVVIGCIAAQAEEKPGPKRSEYDQFIQPYMAKAKPGRFPGPKGTSDKIQVPLRLIVTAIAGDEPQANTREPEFLRQGESRCEVSVDGQTNSIGRLGLTIPKADWQQLDKLLLKLPDDGGRLPPLGRRLVLQVPEGDHSLARVYDRANAPDEVLDILRLSISLIRSWVPEFKAESDILLGGCDTYGVLALTPDRQFVSAFKPGSLTFWDPVAHKQTRETAVGNGMVLAQLAFSPDGSLAALAAICDPVIVRTCVVDTKTWHVLKILESAPDGFLLFSFPRFSRDGRYLLLQSHRLGTVGVQSELRAYDTRTWERIGKLPGLPDGVLDYVEGPCGKHAVIRLKEKTLGLWDIAGRREYARLAERVQSCNVAFSPDESMVAIATKHRHDEKWPFYRVRIWKMDKGDLVHELHPFEQIVCENVVGLQWTADGRYVLAATDADFSENCDINVWSVKSGRHRGNLSGGLRRPVGVVTVPNASHIAAGGGSHVGSVIRFWDLAAALKQIRAFEDSLAGPKAGK